MILNWFQWGLIAFLLIASAFFSSSETALFAMDDMRIRKLADKNSRKRIRTMLKNSSILLVTILLGNTVVNVAVSSLLESQLGIENALLSTAIVTVFLLFFGEITPKTVAIYRVETTSVFNSKILYPFYFIMKPVSRMVEGFSGAVLRLFKIFHKKEAEDKGLEHLSALQSIVSREQIFDEEEKKLIERVLNFAGREVWNIMTPRTKTLCVGKDHPLRDVIKLLKKNKYSKIPVYEGTDDNLVGVIFLSDVFPFVHHPDKLGEKTAGDVMKPMYFVPETKRLSEMLEDFKLKKIVIAAVIDEYGSALGIVTIADVLGEVVGELMDESFTLEKKLCRISKDRYQVAGDISLDDFNAYFGTDLESSEFETLAGYVIEQAGDIPDNNYVLDIGKYKLGILEKSEKHLEKLYVEKD